MTDVHIPGDPTSDEAVHLVEWLVEDRAEVIAGSPLYSIENDKSVVELEAPVTGRLTILEPAGQRFPPGHLVARIS